MKRAFSLATLMFALACGQALAKPPENPGHGHGKPPVTNPGPDLVIDLDTPASSHANFHSPVSNVPEPESMALLAAGVGVVALVAWRRKKNGK